MKLAVLFGLSIRRSTQFLSIDCFRAAAAEQMRSLAAILGLGFRRFDTTLALSQGLEELSRKDLIRSTPPATVRRIWTRQRTWRTSLAGRDDIDRHLVLRLRRNQPIYHAWWIVSRSSGRIS